MIVAPHWAHVVRDDMGRLVRAPPPSRTVGYLDGGVDQVRIADQ